MDRTRRRLMGSIALAMSWPAPLHGRKRSARIARVVVAQKTGEKSREIWRTEFAKHGWNVGQNLDLRFADIRGAPEVEAEARAREVVGSRPDVILMLASEEVILIKRLTRDIPFVFYNVGADPARMGLVESLRRPGGNITGTSVQMDQIWRKAWAMMKEIHPAMKRGGVLLEEPTTYANEDWRSIDAVHRDEMEATGKEIGIELRDVFIPRAAALPVAMEATRKSRAEALRIELTWASIPGLVPALEKARILTCSSSSTFIREGGLLAFTFDFEEGATQAVAIAARILRGESPANIPVYESRRYHVGVNLRTARAMGFAIPASIRVQAAQVIE